MTRPTGDRSRQRGANPRGREPGHSSRNASSQQVPHQVQTTPGAPPRAFLAALEAFEKRGARISGDAAVDNAVEVAVKLNADRWRVRGLLDRWFRHSRRVTWVARESGLGDTLIARWAVFAALVEKRTQESILTVMRAASGGEIADGAALRRAVELGFDHKKMPEMVGLELPDDFAPHFRRAFGVRLSQEALASLINPLVCLRVNTLKATRETVIARLTKEGFRVEPTMLSPFGLTLKLRADIANAPSFLEGLVEVQDEGSQIVAMLVDAQPGMQVLDFCAGAGGKTIALGAAMENKGHLVAADTNAKRLQRARVRLKRSGIENAERVLLTGEANDPWLKKNAGRYERVLIDAPCTGSGAWRRNPDARTTAVIDELTRLTALQAELLERGRKLVKPGGVLVYSTCSVFREENDDIVDAFAERHAGAKPVDLSEINLSEIHLSEVYERLSQSPWPGDKPTRLQLTPALHGTDGFFVAAFRF